MKIIKFFLRFFFILLILFVVAATIYVRIYGKSLLESALNDSLKRRVVLGAVSYRFPFGFRARNVSIAKSSAGGEFLRIERIVAQLSPSSLYHRKLAFDSVILLNPSVLVEGERSPVDIIEAPAPRQGVIVPPDQETLLKAQEGSMVEKNETKNVPVAISIGRLIVKQGRLQYREGLTEKGFSFDLEDIHLKVERLHFPLEPVRSEFMMAARLVKKGNPLSGSHVQASGWADLVKKDMKAKVEVIEENGMVGLTAKAVSRDNNMDVAGEIKMQNLLKGIGQAPADESTINDLVLNALSSAGVEIGAKFAFKTKMDNFRVGQVSFSGSVMTK